MIALSDQYSHLDSSGHFTSISVLFFILLGMHFARSSITVLAVSATHAASDCMFLPRACSHMQASICLIQQSQQIRQL